MNVIESLKARKITPKAVLYARFSSDNQREESIEAQLRALNEFCEKNGVIIVNEYCDRARSAATDNRPEFLRMIADSKKEDFDFIIVHKLDRFSRNRYDSAFYRHELKRNGVSIISVLEQIDDSPESIILESMLDGMSEYYIRNLSREVMKGMRETALKAKSTGGLPPFGLAVDSTTRKFVINEDEAPAVHHIFDCVAKGKGYSQVIKELNDMCYRTRKGKPFGKNSIHEILRNEKYKGVYIFNRCAKKNLYGKRNNHCNKGNEDIIRIEGAIEPIVDAAIFDIVTKIIGSRRRETPSTAKETYLLAGKVVCGECGAALTGNRKHSGRNKTLYVTYRCGGSHLKSRLDCTNKEISRDKLESFVLNELERVIFNEDTTNEIIELYGNFCKQNNTEGLEKIEFVKRKLVGIQAKINNIIGVMAETGSKNLINAMVNLEKEQSQLETELAKSENNLEFPRIDEIKIRAAYRLAREQFLNGILSEKTLLINQYLSKVVVYREHIEVYLNKLPIYLLRLDENLFTSQRGKKNAHNLTLIGGIVSECGEGEEDRTLYLTDANRTLFQMSYIPT